MSSQPGTDAEDNAPYSAGGLHRLSITITLTTRTDPLIGENLDSKITCDSSLQPLKVALLCCTAQPSLAINAIKSINSGRDKAARLRSHTVCGILMHSSLAVTIEGMLLGLAAVKFRARKKFRGTSAPKKRSIRPGFLSRKRKASEGMRPVVGKSQAVYATLGSSGATHPYW